MKATLPLLLLLSATLVFAEPAAPGGASSPSEPPHTEAAEPKPHAESAEPKPHAESAESAEPAAPGGASSPSEPHAESAEPKPHAESAELKPHAESAEAKPHAESAEAKPHADPAESAEPAAPGGASSPSEPAPLRGLPPQAGGGAIQHSASSIQHSPPRPPLHAEVSLVDGSTLKGTLRQHAIPARSPNLGEIRVRLGKVESIAFGKPGAPAKIAFQNGDALSAKFPADRAFVTMDTLVGRVRVPFDKVVSLSIEQPHSAFSTQHSALLYHCTFDSQAAVERPAAGPAGRFFGGTFVPGKFGNALRTYADEPAAEVDFEPGLLGTRGTIEFWAKKEGDTSGRFADLGNLRFFGLWLHAKGETPPWCSTHFQFTSNDGMGMSGLCGMVNHCSWATNPSFGGNPYGLIRDSLADWHHYAVTWDAEGLPGTTASDGEPAVVEVFLDGKPVSTQGRQTLSFGSKHLKAIPGFFAKLAFPTPSNGWGSSGGHIPFLIDEFKIWSVAKTDFTDSGSDRPIQHSAFSTQHSKLLYHCTFDDAQSVEHPATGPDGKFLGGEFVPGKKGNALRVRKGLSSATVRFEKGTLQPRGTIEFWAKIENDREHFGDGGDPRFFMLETSPGSETVFQFAANDGCGRGGLSIYHQGISLASEDHCLYPAAYDSVLEGPTKDWHHYALVWDENGIPGLDGPAAVAAFIDGRRVPLHGDTGLAKAPRMTARFRDNPATLFFSLDPELGHGFNNKTDYLIDEFKIWTEAKTAFDLP